ncbi:MAG: lytic transglycosylase [Deltaproteobacteria bacterium]|nr:MAG: lytic transglycosylase [Deltaproteobacteria bacterium]
MEIHPRSIIRIFIIMILPLFCGSCSADIFHLKLEKQPLSDKDVVEEPFSKPPPSTPEQKIASLPGDKQEEKIGISGEIEEEQKVSSLPKKQAEQNIAVLLSLPKNNEEEVSAIAKKEGRKDLTPLSKNEKEEKIAIPEKPEEEQKVATLSKIDEKQKIVSPVKIEKEEPLPPPEALESSPRSDIPQTPEKTSQEILDSALEFCQASYDFWQQGDLPNAIDALDQAYSLILKVNNEDSPEILQQRDDLRYTISKRIMEVYSSRFTVVNGHNKVIPLVINRHVERALAMFRGRERKYFLDAYRRSGRYRPAIIKALKEAGLPEELSWLPLIESGFKIRALSRSRALGLWQFIASTGYKFGLKRDRWIDERMDPEKSTMAAIAYLKELHQIFGDWTTALAAYNCGEGTVLRCIRTQRISYLDDFWDLYEKLPVETAFYVPKFLAVLHILNDPEAYGFSLPPVEEEIETEDVTIDKQLHLKTVSKHLEVSYRLLKDLNPELRYNYTPDRAYVLKVPKGKGRELLSKLGDIPSWRPPVSSYVKHRVITGECLSAIARRYRTSVRAIMAMNGLKSRHFIRAGWKLKIPTRRYASLKRISLPATSVKTIEKSAEYVVRKGDSLWRIANRFGTTTEAIQSVNKLNDTYLRIGQVLMIPQDVSVFREIKTQKYIVLKGDTPYMIAQRHRMNLSEFLRINRLAPRSTIYPGQVLLVKAD